MLHKSDANYQPTATQVPAAAAPTAQAQTDPTQAAALDVSTVTPPSSASISSSGATKYALAAGTTVRYKTREVLAGHDLPSDVIGTTSNVTGAIVIGTDGSIDAAHSQIVVDAASLQTDQGMRDNFVRSNTLETSKYKNITFVPTQVSGLPSPLPQSDDVNFKLTGSLTIKDVTKPVTWDVTGR